MPNASSTTLLQTTIAFPEGSSLALVGLIALTAIVLGGAVASIRHVWAGDSDEQRSRRESAQPVPTEETELELARQAGETPEDDIGRQRRDYLTDSTRDE